jgi:hypothetical protein
VPNQFPCLAKVLVKLDVCGTSHQQRALTRICCAAVTQFWPSLCALSLLDEWSGGQWPPRLLFIPMAQTCQDRGPLPDRQGIGQSIRASRTRRNDDRRSKLAGAGIEVDRPAGDATVPRPLFDSLDGPEEKGSCCSTGSPPSSVTRTLGRTRQDARIDPS